MKNAKIRASGDRPGYAYLFMKCEDSSEAFALAKWMEKARAERPLHYTIRRSTGRTGRGVELEVLLRGHVGELERWLSVAAGAQVQP